MDIDDPGDVLAIAGDWHGNTEWAVEAVEVIYDKGVDTIIHCGDFGIWPGTSGKTYIRRLNEVLTEGNMRLYFVDGNHEDFDWLDSLPVEDGLQAIYPGRRSKRTHPSRIFRITRGHRWVWRDKIFCGLGGAVSVDQANRIPKKSWWSQEAITYSEAEKAMEGGKVDFLFTHDAPEGVHINYQGLFGVSDGIQRAAENNRKLLQIVAGKIQPEYLFHGHFHMYHKRVVSFNGNPCLVTGLDRDLSRFNTNLEFLSLRSSQ